MNEQILRALLALKDGNPTEWNRLVEQCVAINDREFTVSLVILLLFLTIMSGLVAIRFFIPMKKLDARGIDCEIVEMLIVVFFIFSIVPFITTVVNYCDGAAPWIGLLTPIMKT